MPVINDFLMLLDAAIVDQREGVVVIGATNRIHAVDPAILRPGRLERAITIGPLTTAGILNVLKFHVAGDVSERELGTVAETLEAYTRSWNWSAARGGPHGTRAAGSLPQSERETDIVARNRSRY